MAATKKPNLLLYGLIGGGGAFLLYRLYKELTERQAQAKAEEQDQVYLPPPPPPPAPTPTPTPSGGGSSWFPTPTPAAGFPIKYGQQNSYVLALQKAFNILRVKNPSLKIDRKLQEDGIFGNNTKFVVNTVKQSAKAYQVPITGLVWSNDPNLVEKPFYDLVINGAK